MHRADALLVTGTDLTNGRIAPDNGLHEELGLLAWVGLAPNQILRTTGANAAEALRRGDTGIIQS